MRALPSISGFELRLFGGFDVRLNGEPVAAVAYNKMRALLAYLATEDGQDHGREGLAELLWPDAPAQTARINLRRTLSELRQAVEQPAKTTLFAAGKQAIRFIPNAYVDALDFNGRCAALAENGADALARLEGAISLYRGEFLAGFALPDCPAFDEWLQGQREAFHRRALMLLERLANAHAQDAAYAKALRFALRHIELEPWDEAAHRRAMRLYALNGEIGAASRQYERCCRLLKEGLDVLPCEETRRLAIRIRDGEFGREAIDSLSLPPVNAIAPSVAERRQVTVLYCDLDALAVNEPDQEMAVLADPQARCAETIRALSGHLVQAHGGGLLAYFGYPQAQEDAARRAVRAALAMTDLPALGVGIRVGVHTGLTISGESSMPDTVGRTSKIAIGLRHAAAFGEVAISRSTRVLVEGYFEYANLGHQEMPGSEEAVEAFRVLRETGARTRLDAAVRLTPFIGRGAEMAALHAEWDKAARGACRVVLIQGEAGIGKSRLLHRLKDRLAGRPHVRRELGCHAEFSQSPFQPLIASIETGIEFAEHDTPERRLGKLARHLEANHPGASADAIPLLAQLLGVAAKSAAPSFLQERHKRAAVLLLEVLLSASPGKPVLLIVEDLHWADPSTLELLTALTKLRDSRPVLALLTARQEFVPPWDARHCSTLAVEPLAASQVSDMLDAIGEDLSPAGRARVVQRADGVPLFVEEMAKLAAMDHEASIPDTLKDLLAARLDRLGAAKAVAQLAATIGREFDTRLLREASDRSEAALAQAVDALEDAGLVIRRGEAHQFHHALIQEAAYQSQTAPKRQAAHRRIAQALQAVFPDQVAARPEVLARHLAAAGEPAPSIQYWIKAGQRALQNSAHLEAMGHFHAGRQLLESLPPGQIRDRLEFGILVGLCPVVYANHGIGSAEAMEANARLSALSERVGDSPDLFRAKWALVMHTICHFGPGAGKKPASKLLAMAHDHPLLTQEALRTVTSSAFWRGDFESARIHAEQAIALHRPEQRQQLMEQFGETPFVNCTVLLGSALYFLGLADQAQQSCHGLLEHARRLNYPHTLGLALCYASVLYRWLNKPAEVLALSSECIAISRKHNFPVWLATAQTTHGWALAVKGRREGLAEVEAGVAAMRATTPGLLAMPQSTLIAAYAAAGMPKEALAAIDESLAHAATTGDGHSGGELRQIKGACLLELSPANVDEAEACFDDAMALSRRQGAKTIELRATISLARLWSRRGRRKDARRLLKAAYGKFTEGFGTPDLQEAALLLSDLA